jgi:hypothetical protein
MITAPPGGQTDKKKFLLVANSEMVRDIKNIIG